MKKIPPHNIEPRRYLLALLIMVSGFCGISYEVLYGRLLGDLIGSQFTVNAAILLTFLVGIGWGTLFAHRLWRYLHIVEAFIGLYALSFVVGRAQIDTLFYNADISLAGVYTPLLVCVLLLLAPSFFIGVSLPLMAGYMSRMHAEGVFAKSYAIYNFGAAIVVLLIEYVFIRSIGIRLTTIFTATLNFMAAFLLYFYFADIRRSIPSVSTKTYFVPTSHIAALVFVSIGSAIFQLLMIRVAECTFGPFRETFALVLSLVLGGIAFGSWLVQKYRISFDYVIIANLLGILWLVGGFSFMAGYYAEFHSSQVPVLFAKMLFLVAMMGIPAISFGATIPALLVKQGSVARESGELLFISSMANCAGFLLMVSVLHQRFDYGVLFLWVAFFSAVGLVFYKGIYSRNTVFTMLLFVTLFFLFKANWQENILYLGHTSFDSRQAMSKAVKRFSFPEKFKGPQDIFSIVWANGRPRFFINGYISMALDSPSEPMVGALASVYAPRLDNALVLGVGSGNTAAVAGLLFERTDGIEINGAVMANLHRMKEYNMDIEHNPKVHLVQDDAIHFIKAGSSRYSLIINTVTTPLYFSSAKLYTFDFLQQIKKRMTSDGVYMTWVDSRVGDEGIDIMLKTVGSSFRNCALAYVKSSYFLLLCSDRDIKVHHPQAIAHNPRLGSQFRKEFQIEPNWIAYGLIHPNAFSLIGNPKVSINSLDNPVLEFAMSNLQSRGYDDFRERLRQSMNLELIEKVVEPAMDFKSLELLLHAEMVLGEHSSLTRRWHEIVDSDSLENKDFDRLMISKTIEFAQLAGTADAFHKAGSKLMRKKKYGPAIEALQQALRLNPQRNNSNFNIAACYEYMGEYEQALAAYKAELFVDPDDSDVPYRLGRVLVKQGKFDQALEYLDKGVESAPTARTFYYLAIAYEGLLDREKAKIAYLEALELDDEDEMINDAWQRFND